MKSVRCLHTFGRFDPWIPLVPGMARKGPPLAVLALGNTASVADIHSMLTMLGS